MKSGIIDLVQFATELTRQENTKRDYLVNTQLLNMVTGEGDPVLEMRSENNSSNIFQVNGLMHDQIGQTLGIPAKYYDLMKQEQPGLLADNVNTWFHNKPSDRMVRTLDGTARAFLSNRYRRIDNYQVASAVLPVIQEMTDAKIESMDITDTKMYLKIVNPRLEMEVSKGDIVQSGLTISNSEVGLGSVSVMPLVYRLVCLNGMIVNDAGQRKYHIGRANSADSNSELFRDETLQADDRAFMMKVQDTVRAAVDEAQFAKVVKIMRESKEAKITTTDIPHMIELTGKTFNLSKEENGGILDHLIRGGEFNLYGLANAITRHSQDVKSYDRATELESIGFDVLTMDRGTWNMVNDKFEGRK